MRATCIGNTPIHLDTEHEKEAYARNIHQEQVWLEIGKEYPIYGILFRDKKSTPWFFIQEEENDEYPKPHLAAFFNLTDNTIPSSWAFTDNSGDLQDVALLPKIWADDPHFLERLIDGDNDATKYFKDLISKAHSGPAS